MKARRCSFSRELRAGVLARKCERLGKSRSLTSTPVTLEYVLDVRSTSQRSKRASPRVQSIRSFTQTIAKLVAEARQRPLFIISFCYERYQSHCRETLTSDPRSTLLMTSCSDICCPNPRRSSLQATCLFHSFVRALPIVDCV